MSLQELQLQLWLYCKHKIISVEISAGCGVFHESLIPLSSVIVVEVICFHERINRGRCVNPFCLEFSLVIYVLDVLLV